MRRLSGCFLMVAAMCVLLQCSTQQNLKKHARCNRHPGRFRSNSCQRGHFSVNNRGTAPCRPCPEGTYQFWYGKPCCFLCPPGRSTNGTGAVSFLECKKCPRGKKNVTKTILPSASGLTTFVEGFTIKEDSCTHCVKYIIPHSHAQGMAHFVIIKANMSDCVEITIYCGSKEVVLKGSLKSVLSMLPIALTICCDGEDVTIVICKGECKTSQGWFNIEITYWYINDTLKEWLHQEYPSMFDDTHVRMALRDKEFTKRLMLLTTSSQESVAYKFGEGIMLCPLLEIFIHTRSAFTMDSWPRDMTLNNMAGLYRYSFSYCGTGHYWEQQRDTFNSSCYAWDPDWHSGRQPCHLEEQFF